MAMDPNDYTYKKVEADGDVDTKLTRKGKSTAVTVAIVAVVLAVVAFFVFNDDDDTDVVIDQQSSYANPAASAPVDTTTFGIVNSTRDVAAEVPQAAKDAVTEGDQPTTRPNADGSTNKLDQK